MTFAKLSGYLEKLEKTASRNQITEILADLFKKADTSEIDKICYLVLGRISPQYAGIEFNLAERMMVRAVALAYDKDPKDVTKEYKQVGDLGDVAAALAAHSSQRTAVSKQSVQNVYDKLHEIAVESGEGSQERKLVGVSDLLKKVDPLPARYIVRIPVGKLRLGFSDITMLDALSVMEVGDKSARAKIEALYNVTADIGAIAKRVKKTGLAGIEKVDAVPGVPIRSSLSDRLPTAEKIIEKVGPKLAVEPKFDGFRTQVHITGKREVFLFSRNQENVTSMFPDTVEAAKKLNVNDAIFDGESIGYNPKTDKFVPFQETIQRKRKYGISEMSKQVPLKVFVFDVLHLNGKTLLNKPFSDRRKAIEKLFKGKTGTFLLTEQEIVDDPKALTVIFKKFVGEGLEGIMAKKLDAPYKAGGRGFHWVKFKPGTKSMLKDSETLDTIDCVLMGAFRGKGKRAQFGVGGFLLGVRDGKDKYYTISNLGTGLTDTQFRDMYKRVQKLEVADKPKEYMVDKMIDPDIWVRPKVVLEVLADEITLSTRHTAGMKKTRGYSLRFPRLIKVRDDKSPMDATTVREVEKLYKIQSG
ncbi:DNA ligase [Candidatus Woesebacteria bacterium]|nr:DNA ligase [Candidatus Woesebacteria bacterium]